MARKKANYPLIEGLEITTLAAEGKAMGRWNDVVVFVPLTVPGDVVDVQIRSKRRRFMEGFVVRYVKKSPLRAEAFCEHFGVCGGCKWQNLPYEEQLRFKTGQVRDQLARIGKIALPEIAPCLGSARTQFYRNKLEFTFADRRWLTREEVEGGADIGAAPALGFHIPGMFDKVLDIRKCWLQPDPSNDIRMETKRFCVENGYTFHNAREHTGLMRNMIVRTASTGEVMVTVVFGADDRERIAALLDHLAAAFPQITSLCYVVNTKLNDSVGDLDPVCYKGKDHIVEEMEGLRFKVGPKSFYQTNSEQAYELYKVAREFADLKPEDVLYDLYTGTGTIANFCAAHCRRVVGIEYVPEAIADAKINSEINGIGNTVFYAGDMKQVLSDEFVAANGRPDVIILDPPRAGVDEPVIGVILRAAPERIVYVSCNPATQARDLALSLELFTSGTLDAFAHPTNVDTRNRLLVYDIMDLGRQLKTMGLLVITDAMLNRVTDNWRAGRRTHIFIDEFHVVFENEYSGAFFNSAWRRFRKRNAYPTAITQNVEYLLDSVLASTMLSNSELIVMLNQAAADRGKLGELLNISREQMGYITNAEAGCGLLRYGGAIVPFANHFPRGTELYRLMTTKPGE